MQLMGYLLLACIAMAALQAAAKVLLIGLAVGGVIAFIKHPPETMAFVGMWMAFGLLKAQPAAVLGAVAIAVLANWLKPPPKP